MYKRVSQIYFGLIAMALLLVLTACGGNAETAMSDDEKEIAIAVALTQTAAAIEGEAPASDVATPEPAATEIPAAETPATEAQLATATVETPADAESDADTAVSAADGSTAENPATEESTADAAASDSTTSVASPDTNEDLSAATLPITQNQTKVRTLLVAPGEPGPLYALVTDEALATAAAANAQLLVSLDFGATWAAFASGLPVAGECLMNVNMDYYGATALYASTCEGIYRWVPGDETWTLISTEEVGMVAIVYGNDDILWATRPFTPEGAPVIVSQDGGESWLEITMDHFNGVANLGISPRDSQSAYAIIWPESAGSYLRRGSMLRDWQTVPTPANNMAINTGMTIDGGTGWLYVSTMEPNGDRLWRSTDADTPLVEDVSWTVVHEFAPELTVELLSSGWSPTEDELTIYANLSAIVDGEAKFFLIRSTDSGQSWEPLIINAG